MADEKKIKTEKKVKEVEKITKPSSNKKTSSVKVQPKAQPKSVKKSDTIGPNNKTIKEKKVVEVKKTTVSKKSTTKPKADTKKVATKPKADTKKVATKPKVETKKVATKPKVETKKVATKPKVETKKVATKPKVETNKTSTKPKVDTKKAASTSKSKDKIAHSKAVAVERSKKANVKNIKEKKTPSVNVKKETVIPKTVDKKKTVVLKSDKVQKKTTSIPKTVEKRNLKTNLREKTIFSTKTRKIFLGIVIFCVLLLSIELVYFLAFKNNNLNKSIFYDSLNSVDLDKTDIVVAGSSNFKNSKFNSYTKGLEKAKLVKHDKSGKILFEKMYDKGINSTFNSIITVNDGYIVVGSYEATVKQSKERLRTALIIKYDKDGNVVWEKDFSSLADTKFNKVIATDDGYIAIGQSIYESIQVGNSTDGGGIIVKYDVNGKIIWKNNHGGNKSASFNGITVVNGDIYVAGRDGTDFGNLVKFSSSGEYVWHRNYRYTDSLGFTDIEYMNDNLYLVGAKKIFDHEVTDESERDTNNTDALLVQYNLNGDFIFEKTFGGSKNDRYNSVMVYKNNLFVIGSTASKDSGLKIFTDGILTTGVLIKYDKDGNIERRAVYGGSNQDNLTDIVTDNSNLYITAYTNSKDGNIMMSKDNGKDYFGRLIKVDSRLRILFLK